MNNPQDEFGKILESEGYYDNVSQITDVPKIPHSIEAEKAVLGSLLLNPNAWEEVAPILEASDFFRMSHRTIFTAIQDVAADGTTADVITVAMNLDRNDLLVAVGDMAAIGELADGTPSSANAIGYANVVKDFSLRRAAIIKGQELAQAALNPDGKKADELIQDVLKDIEALNQSSSKEVWPTFDTLLKGALADLDKRFRSDDPLMGITSGFKRLDDMMLGLCPADLIVVGGRPSMGKTTLAMNFVEAAVMSSDKQIVVFTMEMPAGQILQRLFASIGKISNTKVRTGKLEEEDWPKLSSAISKLKGCNLHILDKVKKNPIAQRAELKRIERDHGPIGLIMADYLQLMHMEKNKENRTGEISSITRELKSTATEFNAPFVLVSQLNRSLENRPNKRPVNSDLRESGAIEQDADVILFVYRDEVYNEESADKGVAEIIIGKQRNGPIGTCRLAFRGQFTRFDNLDMNHNQY